MEMKQRSIAEQSRLSSSSSAGSNDQWTVHIGQDTIIPVTKFSLARWRTMFKNLQYKSLEFKVLGT